MSSRRRKLRALYEDEARRSTELLLEDPNADIAGRLSRLDTIDRLLQHQAANWKSVRRPLVVGLLCVTLAGLACFLNLDSRDFKLKIFRFDYCR